MDLDILEEFFGSKLEEEDFEAELWIFIPMVSILGFFVHNIPFKAIYGIQYVKLTRLWYNDVSNNRSTNIHSLWVVPRRIGGVDRRG